MSWIAALLLLAGAILGVTEFAKQARPRRGYVPLILALLCVALIFQFSPGTSHQFHF